MNLVLAVSIILVLGCTLFVRVVCLYNIQRGTNVLSKSTNVVLIIATISLIVFIAEFVFNVFNVII